MSSRFVRQALSVVRPSLQRSAVINQLWSFRRNIKAPGTEPHAGGWHVRTSWLPNCAAHPPVRSAGQEDDRCRCAVGALADLYRPKTDANTLPQDSFTEVMLPFSSDEDLRADYITYMGTIRVGRLLEDLVRGESMSAEGVRRGLLTPLAARMPLRAPSPTSTATTTTPSRSRSPS